jgi:hypothetical protein
MTLELIIAFSILLGAINSQQRAIDRFNGASQTYLMCCHISCFIGLIVGIGLMIYYGYCTVWYCPVIVGAIAAIASIFVFGIVYGLARKMTTMGIGVIFLDFSMFVIWPASALWIYKVIGTI